MKRLIFTCIGFLLIVIACQKEVIKPQENTVNYGTEQSNQVMIDNDSVSTPNHNADSSGNLNNGSGITDPNNDPDMYKRAKNN